MIFNYNKKLLSFICVITLICPVIIYADDSPKRVIGGMGWAYNNQREFQALPQYCKARFYPSKSNVYQSWMKRFGPDFIHIHHY